MNQQNMNQQNMNQQNMNQQNMNQQNMCNLENEEQFFTLDDLKNIKYDSKSSGLGKAGAILNIIGATIWLQIMFIFSFIFLSELILGVFCLVPLLLSFLILIVITTISICSIVSNARFLEGKTNKRMAGMLAIITGNLLGAIFVFCSYRIKTINKVI